MAETNTQESEENAMLLRGPLAVEFFTLYLSRSPGKKVHLLTSQGYLTVNSGSNFITNRNGVGFPEGIDRFVETALQDESCDGLVPLTESVEQKLKDKKLEAFPAVPITFFDDSLKYTLYKR